MPLRNHFPGAFKACPRQHQLNGPKHPIFRVHSQIYNPHYLDRRRHPCRGSADREMPEGVPGPAGLCSFDLGFLYLSGHLMVRLTLSSAGPGFQGIRQPSPRPAAAAAAGRVRAGHRPLRRRRQHPPDRADPARAAGSAPSPKSRRAPQGGRRRSLRRIAGKPPAMRKTGLRSRIRPHRGPKSSEAAAAKPTGPGRNPADKRKTEGSQPGTNYSEGKSNTRESGLYYVELFKPNEDASVVTSVRSRSATC